VRANIRKWGNSLAIRIPKALADELGLAADARVDVTADGGKLVVTPAAPWPRYTLDELMANFDPASQHPEIDWGPPVGSEEW
jgi:antitoxin MazE